jgi:hypothetical protein
LLREPGALWRILHQAVPATHQFIIFYGQVEGREFGRIEDEGLRFSSLGRFFGNLSGLAYTGLFIFSLLGGLIALVLLLRGEDQVAPGLCVLLNAVITSTFLACLLGGGYVDLARHFHVAQSALMLAPVPAMMVVGRAVFRVRPLRGLLQRFSVLHIRT